MKRIISLSLLIAALFCTAMAEEIDTSLVLKEVVVTGSQVKVSRRHLPQTISVITRDEIESSSESALLPVISERVPGVFVTERSTTGFGVGAGSAGQINIRGIGSGSRVLTMFDGQPQWAGIFGHHLPDTYVASDVERVEVIRGPASLLYGSNAMGGVINIITRGEHREGVHGQARISYGSYNTQKYLLNGSYKSEKFSSFISLNHDRTDGHRPDSRFHITNGYVKLGYEISNYWKATGDVTIAKFYSQNPGTVSVKRFDNWVDALRGTYSMSLENNYEKTSGAIKLYYNMGDHQINDGYKTGEEPLKYLFESRDHVAGFVAYQSVHLFCGNTITAGIDHKNWGGKAWNSFKDKDVEIIDKTVNETALYAMAQQSLFEKLSVNAGMRVEMNEAYGSEWVPQAGIAYHPCSGTTIKASYSKGFRSPNIRELYMYDIANPDLKPERTQSYDISFLQSLLDGRLSLELTGFITTGDNLIVRGTVDGKIKNINSGTINNKGVEFASNFKLMKNLSFLANYSYLDMENPIVAAPRHQLFAGVNYTIKKVTLDLHYQMIEGLYQRTGNSELVESYSLINAKATYRPLNYLSLYVKGENLTDRQYSINEGFPMPGITVLGGVSVSF